MDPPTCPVPPEQVAKELSEPLRRYLQRYTGNPTLAEDLLQDTLIRVVRGLPAFEGRASVKTWAFSIATRVAADHFRKPAQRVQVIEFDDEVEVADDETSVGQDLITGEMNACIRQVIDSLPEDYRAALVLHDLEGLTAIEVGEVCGCSVPTAKIRIHRARQRLKQALQQECDFYRDSESVLRCDRKCDE